MRRISAVLLRSFLQGLILISPIAATGYLLFRLYDSVDSIVPYQLIPFIPRGIGFLLIMFSITLIGYLGTRFFLGRWLFDAFAFVLEHTPGVKHLYSALRDMVESFVGEKKKFSKPVWVLVHNNPETWRIGFITQKDVSGFGMTNMIAVYLPQSYSIAGWVVVIEAQYVRAIKEMNAAEAMKFALSGGITIVDDDKTAQEDQF